MKNPKDLRIVFMGTPEFAVGILQALVESEHNVVGVVTTVDKPAGRGRQLRTSAVKDYVLGLDCSTPCGEGVSCGEGEKNSEKNGSAENCSDEVSSATSSPVYAGIKLMQPEKLRDEAFLGELRELEADLFIVVAFRMLPEVVWAMPKLGTFNLHASLLPDYRGAAPINWAIMNGDTRSGVTTFMLNHEIDCGGILMQRECAINPSDNVEDLYNRLMQIGEGLVIETVEGLAKGEIKPMVQNENAEVMRPAPKLFKDIMELVFDAETSVLTLHNKVRGLSPYPAAWVVVRAENKAEITAKIFRTHTEIEEVASELVGVWQTDGGGYLRLGLKDGWLYIDELQPQNKKRMPIVDFLRGWR